MSKPKTPNRVRSSELLATPVEIEETKAFRAVCTVAHLGGTEIAILGGSVEAIAAAWVRLVPSVPFRPDKYQHVIVLSVKEPVFNVAHLTPKREQPTPPALASVSCSAAHRGMLVETIECALRNPHDAGYREDALNALNELREHAKRLEAAVSRMSAPQNDQAQRRRAAEARALTTRDQRQPPRRTNDEA